MARSKSPATVPAFGPVKKKRTRGRPRGQVATQEIILRAAVKVFAADGYAGARIDTIAKTAKSANRMIYYYFKSKQALFIAVLERIFKELGDAEAALDLSGFDPETSLRALISFTWNHYRTHPEMLTLLNNENLHQGRHMARSRRIKELSFPLLSFLRDVLARGVKEKVFRADIDAYDLYIINCAVSYFYLSNCFTMSAFLDRNLMTPRSLANWEQVIQDVVVRYVAASPAPG
jgi:AcrR family transcriptional regulator